jgi:hypothetical protein
MAKEFRLLTSNHLPLTAAGLNSVRDFVHVSESFNIQLAYGMSMVLPWCLFLPEINSTEGQLRPSSNSKS